MLSHRAIIAIFTAFAASAALAGEVAVDPVDDGADILEDTTEDADSRSSEVAAVAEQLVGPPLAEIEIDEVAIPLADAVTAAEGVAATITVLGNDVIPGTSVRLSWSATELFEGVPVSTPVLVVNGALPGPTLCMTAAVHGDDRNGIAVVRRVMHDLSASKVSGAVIGIPIVYVQGF